ncbi:hypothetical protein NU688_25540 [Variovorax sp. ZS18.2.2]|uniref:hypothetical protein n=1 Tax=Variovorax sp. ZS18.2.2 TaxID=2971255 RepID=UPI00215191F9|nr:hypothetical protein [Variovorax sp. ZS18.2.2]MCR6479547.1 hypothetical protein [Variovorax sp. ZS18.2.2]
MNTRTTRLAWQLLLLLSAAGSASAGTIACVPSPSSAAGSFNWIRRIAIDEHSRTVSMDIVRSRTKDTETMGKMRAELVSMDGTSSGEPIYLFNAIPAAGDEVTSLFRLFKSGDWQLARAGVVFVNKVPALRSVEPNMMFDCKRSDLG